MIKAPLSLNLYVSYLRTTHIQTTSFARPFARLFVLVVVGTREWECGETSRANNRLVVQSRRFYVIIFVSIDMRFPSFGMRYQCEWPRWRIALFQFSVLFSPFVQLVRRSATQFFPFQANTNNNLPTDRKKSQNLNKITQLVSILFLSKSRKKNN